MRTSNTELIREIEQDVKLGRIENRLIHYNTKLGLQLIYTVVSMILISQMFFLWFLGLAVIERSTIVLLIGIAVSVYSAFLAGFIMVVFAFSKYNKDTRPLMLKIKESKEVYNGRTKVAYW